MVVAGGVAVNFYTGNRATLDVDASFSRCILLPEDLIVPYMGSDGKLLSIHLDRNYNPTSALMHEDYEKDALLVKGPEFEDDRIELRILSPLDLALSKIARFEGPDREDIKALAGMNLISAEELAERANEAINYYVGNTDRLTTNLSQALREINEVQMKSGTNGKSDLGDGR